MDGLIVTVPTCRNLRSGEVVVFKFVVNLVNQNDDHGKALSITAVDNPNPKLISNVTKEVERFLSQQLYSFHQYLYQGADVINDAEVVRNQMLGSALSDILPLLSSLNTDDTGSSSWQLETVAGKMVGDSKNKGIPTYLTNDLSDQSPRRFSTNAWLGKN